MSEYEKYLISLPDRSNARSISSGTHKRFDDNETDAGMQINAERGAFVNHLEMALIPDIDLEQKVATPELDEESLSKCRKCGKYLESPHYLSLSIFPINRMIGTYKCDDFNREKERIEHFITVAEAACKHYEIEDKIKVFQMEEKIKISVSKYDPDCYVMISEAWMPKNLETQQSISLNYQHSNITKLPSYEQIEILTFIAKTKNSINRGPDKSELYEIIREKQNDENSKILELRKTNNGRLDFGMEYQEWV
jgi:hypothetical protein